MVLQNDVGGGPVSVFTDAGGSYTFHVPLSESYTLTMFTPTGWTHSLVTTGELVQHTGLFESTMTMPTVGLFHEITIAGKMFFDTNHLHYQDGAEKNMPYITVSLYDDTDTLVTSSPSANPDLENPTSTDRNGRYSFALTESGVYHVVFSNVASVYWYSNQNVGAPATDNTDSDTDSTGVSDGVSYSYGEEESHLDAGTFLAPAMIGNYVWNDSNFDGVQNSGETGLAGVTVKLVNLEDSSIVATAVTNDSGIYSMTAYFPQCDGPNDNVDLGDVLSVTKECSIDHAGGLHYITFTTSTDCSSILAEITLLGADGRTLYTDHCGGEGGLTDGESVTVGPFTELGAGTATLHFSSEAYVPPAPTESMLGGFSNISWRYARYQLHVSDLATGYVFSPQDTGDNVGEHQLTDSDCDEFGITDAHYVDLLLSGTTDTSWDFGAYDDGFGSAHLHIFSDTNGNGSQSAGEADSYPGATLTISHGTSSEEAPFDDHGNFDSVMAVGSYVLSINNPSGTSITGGSNHILVTITSGTATDIGHRGVRTSSSSSGSGGSSGSVSYGSSSSASRGTSRSYSSTGASSSSSSSHSSAVVTEELPAVQANDPACLKEGSSVINFTDVRDNSDVSFLTSLTFLSAPDRHLIRGYGDNTFGPDHFLTRFELLKIALGSNCIGGGNSTTFSHPNSYFIDVPHDNSEESQIIGEAYSRGIIHGVGNHFYPDNPVSLGETIKMLVGSSGYFNNGLPLTTLPVTTQGVTDPSFLQPVEYARRLNILSSTNFAQNDPVNRLAMANILARFIHSMQRALIVS